MDETVLSKRLKKLREERGYLQKFVADKIGVKSNTLSGYENGSRTPDPELIRSLATLYDVTTDYLLGHSDDPLLTKEEEKEVNEEVEQLIKMIETLPEEEQKQMWDRVLAYARGVTDARNND